MRLVGGRDGGRVVGATTLGDLDEAAGFAHIGGTGYDPRVWGTAVNPATRLALLRLAFGHGYRHVRLQADEANVRSRAAIERLGARFVELRQRDRVRADGSVAGRCTPWSRPTGRRSRRACSHGWPRGASGR